MKNLSILFILNFTLLFTLPINGQRLKPCTLGLANAPNLRGLKLGISPTQVEKILGQKIILKDYKPSYTDEMLAGVKKYYFSKSSSEKIPNQLDGIDALFLDFYNNSLYRIFIIYGKPAVAWKDSKEFVLYLSDKFDLPKDSWSGDKYGKYLFCNEFSLSANIIEVENSLRNGSPLLSLTNDEISKLVNTKESQLVEKYKPKRRMLELEQEKGFKP